MNELFLLKKVLKKKRAYHERKIQVAVRKRPVQIRCMGDVPTAGPIHAPATPDQTAPG